jgi:hypothetical protein
MEVGFEPSEHRSPPAHRTRYGHDSPTKLEVIGNINSGVSMPRQNCRHVTLAKNAPAHVPCCTECECVSLNIGPTTTPWSFVGSRPKGVWQEPKTKTLRANSIRSFISAESARLRVPPHGWGLPSDPGRVTSVGAMHNGVPHAQTRSLDPTSQWQPTLRHLLPLRCSS